MVIYQILEAYFDEKDIYKIGNYNVYFQGRLTTSEEDLGNDLDIYIEDENNTFISFDKEKIVALLQECNFNINSSEFKEKFLKIIECNN